MRWLVAYLFTLGAVLAVHPSALAEGFQRRPEVRINRVDTTKSPEIRIYFTEIDSAAKVVTGRKPKSYRLVVDGLSQGQAESVKTFASLKDPVAVVLVIQISPSMQESLSEVINSAKRLFKSLEGRVEAGVVAYTDVVVKAQKPTSVEKATEVLDGLRIREDALTVNLPDAIRDALEMLKPDKLPQRKLLVVISDGLTADLRLPIFQDLGRKASQQGITVHSIGFAPLEPTRLRTLFELSKYGRGTFRDATTARAVAKLFADLQDEVLGQLVVSKKLPDNKVPDIFDGEEHDFEIRIAGSPNYDTRTVVTSKHSGDSKGGKEPPLAAAGAEDTKGGKEPGQGQGVDEDEIWKESTGMSTGAVVGIVVGGLALIAVVVLLFLKFYLWKDRGAGRPAAVMGRDADAALDNEDGDFDDDMDDEEDDEDEDDEDEDDVLSPAPGQTAPAPMQSTAPQPLQPSPAMAPVHDPLSAPAPLPTSSLTPAPSLPEPQAPAPLAGPQVGSSPMMAFPSASGQQAAPAGIHPDTPLSNKTMPAPDEQWPASPSTGSMPQAPPADFAAPPATGAADQQPMPAGPLGVLNLPSPEEFLKNAGNIPADPAPPQSGQATQGQAAVPRDPIQLPDFPVKASFDEGQSAVTGSGIPLAPGSNLEVLPSAPPPADDSGGGAFWDRKTQVLASAELEEETLVAWIVPLDDPGLPTVKLRNGFVLGSEATCDFIVHGEGVEARHAVLDLDSHGYWLRWASASPNSESQPLQDNDRFRVGEREFLFKMAQPFSEQARARARLEVIDGYDQGRTLALQDGVPCAIGKHPSCALVIRGEGIGSRHAIALRKKHVCFIEDLGTEAGVFFGGAAVGSRSLRPGEEIQLGQVRLIFACEE